VVFIRLCDVTMNESKAISAAVGSQQRSWKRNKVEKRGEEQENTDTVWKGRTVADVV